MAYRKTMKFTDVTSKYSGPDRMDFTEWLEKAEHAFQVMGLHEAKEKVEIFPVYMEEPCNDIARVYIRDYKELNAEPAATAAKKTYYETLYGELKTYLKGHAAVGGHLFRIR